MNIVTIDFEFCHNPGKVTIGHNATILSETYQCQSPLTFEIYQQLPNNIFWVSTESELVINWISMFDLGKDKLVYQGLCTTNTQETYQSQLLRPGDVWKILYSAPVFSWIHQTLNHGWLVQPD